jgi:phosphate transport system substrate-binding protein
MQLVQSGAHHHACGARTVRRRGVLWAATAVMLAPPFVLRGANATEQVMRVGGVGAAAATMTLATMALEVRGRGHRLRQSFQLGSSGAVRAVEQGALDLAMISRPLLVEERMRGLQAFEYGRTPLALATRQAEVRELTRREFAEMLERPGATWPDGTPVRLVMRPRTDGDHILLAGMGPLVQLALDHATAREGMVTAYTDHEAAEAIARLRGGLGPCSLALLRSGSFELRALTLDGVAPTVANVDNTTYRVVNRMHLVTLGPPKGLARELIEFFKTPEGQLQLAELGHSTRIAR